MKILLFIDSLTGAGAQRQLVNLAVGLKMRGHSVTVATYYRLDFFKPRLQKHQVELIEFVKKYRFDLSPIIQLHRHLSKSQPDVVVAFLRTPAVYAEICKLFKPGIPVIASERCGREPSGMTRGDRLAAKGHRLATAVTANSADYIAAMTEYAPNLKEKTTLIYNGVDNSFLDIGRKRLANSNTKQSSENTSFSAAHSSPGSAVTSVAIRHFRFCVVAARATRQKAPLVLAKAITILKKRGITNFTLDWNGPVDFQSELVKQVCHELETSQLEALWRWQGASEDVGALYPQYDAYLSPSLFEGVSNTLCEAMASALPVLVSDIADNANILETGNTSGTLFPAGNPKAIADALQGFMALSEQQRAAFGKNSHETAAKLFAMKQYISSWESLCLAISRQARTS